MLTARRRLVNDIESRCSLDDTGAGDDALATGP